IIGENGSGKSTLLKLVTRILEPTSGKVTVSGNVSALIELGAGFHPDLTGRENIYLNGSILGYSRRDMDRLYDDMVAFSELERFIDTPVKHYSSGMYARLGFSVAISVDPDILIIDEVLSVGDEAFQRKCLDRIDRFRRDGKALLFVSHGLDTVAALCDRVVWLDHGVVKGNGLPGPTIQRYRDDIFVDSAGLPAGSDHEVVTRSDSGKQEEFVVSRMAVRNVRLLTGDGRHSDSFETGQDVVVR